MRSGRYFMARNWQCCVAVAVLALFLSLGARADTPPPPQPAESQLVEHGHYTNKDGVDVHSPAHTKTGQPPPGATAKCSDGMYSFSLHHSGTCSHHGGVAQWIH
jgi:Protein of unknown function (DUF3761)